MKTAKLRILLSEWSMLSDEVLEINFKQRELAKAKRKKIEDMKFLIPLIDEEGSNYFRQVIKRGGEHK